MTRIARSTRTAPRARAVEVEARAKLNLGLAIGPRRADGFHDLATVFQSVTLADSLIVRPRRSGFRLAVRRDDASLGGRPPRREAIPAGPSNLVLRAARLLAERLGLEAGADFTLIKRIPSRSGLGGGSADAAAAIAGLNALYGLRRTRVQLLALAAELGSDVPFALLGGTALGLGRGERLTRLTLACPFSALVAVPSWRVSTRSAFDQIDRDKYVLTTWRTKLKFARSIGRDAVDAIRSLRLGNTFEQVLGDRRQDFERLRDRLMRAGAEAVRMTGSGSAVFAIPGPGSPAMEVASRFAGSETLYAVRSARSGVRLRMLP